MWPFCRPQKPFMVQIQNSTRSISSQSKFKMLVWLGILVEVFKHRASQLSKLENCRNSFLLGWWNVELVQCLISWIFILSFPRQVLNREFQSNWLHPDTYRFYNPHPPTDISLWEREFILYRFNWARKWKRIASDMN